MGRIYTDAQRKATNNYQKKELEIVSFRVKKGKRESYNQLAKKRNTSLSGLLENYLDNECKKENIPINIKKEVIQIET